MTRAERIAAFPLGCRVTLSQHAWDRGILRTADRHGDNGTVVGHGKQLETLIIKRDGRSTPGSFHYSFWERIDYSVVSPPDPTPDEPDTSKQSAARFLALRAGRRRVDRAKPSSPRPAPHARKADPRKSGTRPVCSLGMQALWLLMAGWSRAEACAILGVTAEAPYIWLSGN